MVVDKKMSQKILQDVDNFIDNKLSDYYYYNKRKRHFWHSRSTTISCRVRDKNNINTAPDMAINIRAFLLKYEEKFLKEVWSTANKLQEKDMKQLRNYIYSLFPDVSEEELNKKMGLIIMNLPEEEIKGALNLAYVVSCRLLGYEKELIFLKAYKIGILPAFILRSLYHTNYDHNNFIRDIEEIKEELSLEVCNPYKGIDFSLYLEKLKFL